MFRYVLSLPFTVGLASAATIITIANCQGVTIVGTNSAMCVVDGESAEAFVTAPPFADTQGPPFNFDASARVGGPLVNPPSSAQFAGDFVFTVTGGVGNGFFFPCFVGIGYQGAGSFAGIGSSFSDSTGFDTCLNNRPQGTPKPFTFGVPLIVPLELRASARVVPIFRDLHADMSFDRILFFGPSGNLLQNANYTLVSVDIPEPSAWSFLVGGVMFLAGVAVKRIPGGSKLCKP